MTNLGHATRTTILRPSPTIAITGKAAKLRAEGIDIVSFGAGEPDFPTPEPVCEAAIDAIRSGFTKYTTGSGIAPLKQAIVRKMLRENGIEVDEDRVLVTVGAKQAVYNALMVLVDPADEVILFSPYWMTYEDQVRLAGGVPVIVPTFPEDDFVPDPQRLIDAITEKTRCIIVNTPNNPSGSVYPRESLETIATIALERGIWLVSDEIYERLTYGREHVSLAAINPEIEKQTITVSGCSKSYSMTGWRVGYLIGPRAVIQYASNLQDQVTSNVTSFVQVGAIAALDLDPAIVDSMRDEFQTRRDLMGTLLANIPGVEPNVPGGAFYHFPSVKGALGGKLKSDTDLAEFLLTKAHVATVPGSVFGAPGHLRLSYATSEADIRKGLDRIAEVLAGACA